MKQEQDIIQKEHLGNKKKLKFLKNKGRAKISNHQNNYKFERVFWKIDKKDEEEMEYRAEEVR